MTLRNRILPMIAGFAVLAGCTHPHPVEEIRATAVTRNEFNLRNTIGFMEFCAAKGYIDPKLAAQQKKRFASDLDPSLKQEAAQAYTQGRRGSLRYLIDGKPVEESGIMTGSKPSNPQFDLKFTHEEDRNGELAIYCKRIAETAVRQWSVFAPPKPEEPKPDEFKDRGGNN